MPREKSAGAIIFRKENGQNHYLLLRYRSGHWEFPRGHIEKGESEEQAARREVREETGIKDLKIIPGFKEYTKFLFKKTYNLKPEEKKKAPWVFKLVYFFVAETTTKEVRLDEENTGFLWLPYEQALKRLTYKPAKEVFKKAHDFLVSGEGV